MGMPNIIKLRHTISVSLPDTVIEALNKFSYEAHMKRSNVVEEAIKLYITGKLKTPKTEGTLTSLVDKKISKYIDKEPTSDVNTKN